MIGSSDNSSGVVVGALVCGTECIQRVQILLHTLIFFSFHLSNFF